MMNNIFIEKLQKPGQALYVISLNDYSKGGLNTLLDYVNAHKKQIDDSLIESGAILFRGFGVFSNQEFLTIKEAIAGSLNFSYVDGNSPRTKISDSIYTSTEYPKEYRIPLHSEMSYSNRWPRLLFFMCMIPSAEGGETPIADCRVILKELGTDVVSGFEELGVKYTRFLYGSGNLGKSWMDTFQSSDKAVVEKFCKENNIEFIWYKDSLYLSQIGLGVARHPITDDKVWFNQADQFHPSSLPGDIYRGLKMLYANSKYKFPQYALYGNGEEIPEEHLKKITEAHFDCAFKFKWEKGDLLVLDNMLMSHGRMPFSGERKILVSMS